MKVGIYIYDNAEVLDFSGPFEVLTTANRVSGKSLFDVSLVAQNAGVVVARAGYKVLADVSFDDAPQFELLIVVGGDHSQEIHKTVVSDWIAQQANKAKLIASVCTGAFLLAQAGVITTQQVTTHWQDITQLQLDFPRLDVQKGLRWLDAGNIVTSDGISAGIDMTLHLVSRLHSEALALKTAKQMEFLWLKNN
jgi:transcriptional regulator GlxA family with amidase domain